MLCPFQFKVFKTSGVHHENREWAYLNVNPHRVREACEPQIGTPSLKTALFGWT